MPMGCWFFDEFGSCESSPVAWSHAFSHLPKETSVPYSSRFWTSVGVVPTLHRFRSRSTIPSAPKGFGKKPGGYSIGQGPFSFGSGVRSTPTPPPCGRDSHAEPTPKLPEDKDESQRDRQWQREHLKLTSKHIPGRVPLPDKGKPVARRGRKATDQISDLKAGLPEEE